MRMRSAMLAVAVIAAWSKWNTKARRSCWEAAKTVCSARSDRRARAAEGARQCRGSRRKRRLRPAERRAAAAGERAAPATPSFAVRGTIESVGKTKITLTTRGSPTDYELAPDAIVTIDGKPAKLEDLAAGMLVSLDRKEEGSGHCHQGGRAHDWRRGQIGRCRPEDDYDHDPLPPPRGPDQTYALADNVSVVLDRREPAKVSEIQPGMTGLLEALRRQEDGALDHSRSTARRARHVDPPRRSRQAGGPQPKPVNGREQTASPDASF